MSCEYIREIEKEARDVGAAMAAASQSQPAIGLNLRVVGDALAVISGVRPLSRLPVIQPSAAEQEPERGVPAAPPCSCDAHEGPCSNLCDSAETAVFLNFIVQRLREKLQLEQVHLLRA